jgi:uncharacterized glyoxalase superfamily protein PhnB
MAEATSAIPVGVSPYLTVKGGKAALDFYTRAFGASEEFRAYGEDGERIMHARFRVNGGAILLSDHFPEFKGGGRPLRPAAGSLRPFLVHRRADQEIMRSPQRQLLETLAERISAGALHGLADYFTADFVLHDPNAPAWPCGREGAQRMIDAFAALAADRRLEIVDAIEQADRVAVRWSITGTNAGDPFRYSCVAIYRFRDGLIAEDWGISARADWP